MPSSNFPGRWFLCQRNHLPGNMDQLRKKTAVSGGKTKKKLPNFFLRLWDTYKKYILQKNWVKTAIPALSSGQNNLQVPIWGCHRQLDDQCRNPNMNNKDHLVGQLTRGLTPARLVWSFFFTIYRRKGGGGP